MDFKNSETLKNLTRAFSAECQDGAFYQYMADQATQQKLSEVATILKQLATNEMAHAKIFYDYISEKVPGGVENVDIKASYPMKSGNLTEMLKNKEENENKQADSVYPSFSKTAMKEGFEDISKKISRIAKIEDSHADVLRKLHYLLESNSLYTSKNEEKWKCLNCGYVEMLKKAWKKCPLCCKDQGYIKINLNNKAE